MSKKQNAGNQRTIKSIVLIQIWTHLDYTSGGNLLPMAELKRVHNICERKALGADSGEVFRF